MVVNQQLKITLRWLSFGVVFVCMACAPITPLPTVGAPPMPPIPGLPSSGLPSGVPPAGLPGPPPSASVPSGQSGGQPPNGPPDSGASGVPGAPGAPGKEGSPSSGGQGDPSSYDQLPSGGGLPGGTGGVDEADEAGGADGGPDGGTDGSDGNSANNGSDAASGNGGTAEEPSWQELAGTGGDGEPDNDGWDVSNEIPDASGQGAGTTTTDEVEKGGSIVGGEGKGEFEGALEEMDGEILAGLEAAKSSAGRSNVPTPLDSSPGADGDGEKIKGLPRSVQRSIPTPRPPRRGTEQLPDDIPDAKDDNIIARQLREAAMAEQDSELKEKLWEEYRKYKKG